MKSGMALSAVLLSYGRVCFMRSARTCSKATPKTKTEKNRKIKGVSFFLLFPGGGGGGGGGGGSLRF